MMPATATPSIAANAHQTGVTAQKYHQEMPPIGAFLRPLIGGQPLHFCYRVVGHFKHTEWTNEPLHCVSLHRWGLSADGTRPMDDGRIAAGYGLELVPTHLPGVWRDADDAGPDYERRTFVLMDRGPDGQADLF